MKQICLLIIILLFSIQLNGQKNNQLNEMICSSINSYTVWNNDFAKRVVSTPDTCLYYICKDGLPADFPLGEIKNAVYFSLYNLSGLPKSFQKKLKKGITAYFIWIKLNDRQLIITINDRSVKFLKNNNVEISIGNCGVFNYKYSCEEQKWLLHKTEYGGI